MLKQAKWAWIRDAKCWCEFLVCTTFAFPGTVTSDILFSTIAVDKFVDKLMKGRVSHPPVTAFSYLAIF
ncbi:MAG: hypothetical protein ABS69_13520 [Nitrosomonadales bacterium SCN 54-20]|nr:MAG: hypothetical protein ABS69_13520 [Nitrosomonadales bacterium SCN 54-20]